MADSFRLLSIIPKIDKRTIYWIVALLGIALLASNLAMMIGKQPTGPSAVAALIRDPTVLAVLGAVLTFLVFDRWRNLDAGVEELKRSQGTALRELRKETEELVKAQLADATRRAHVIESRISNLVRDNPWIEEITKSEFIPEATACRIVRHTAEELLRSERVTLAYDYLFRRVQPVGDDTPLRGTADDFIDLAEFCERDLGDEYLAFCVFSEGHQHALNPDALLPMFLRCAIRHGSFELAMQLAERLRSLLIPGYWRRIVSRLRRRPQYRRATFRLEGFTALATFEQLAGRKTEAVALLAIAKQQAVPMHAHFEVRTAEAEIQLISGAYDDAKRTIEVGSRNDTPDLAFEAARVQRALGNIAEARRLLKAAGFHIATRRALKISDPEPRRSGPQEPAGVETDLTIPSGGSPIDPNRSRGSDRAKFNHGGRKK